MDNQSDRFPAGQFVVKKDNREKPGHGWQFDKRTKDCLGTEPGTLATGDYSVKGLEDIVILERKGCCSEYAGNLFQDRFRRELDRLSKFKFAYVILEFPFEDMVDYPRIKSISPFVRKRIKLTGPTLLKTHLELERDFPSIRWHFAGIGGKSMATSIFRRAIEYAATIGRFPEVATNDLNDTSPAGQS